MSIKQTLT